MVVVITSTGGVTKRRLHVRAAGRSGSSMGGAVPEREARRPRARQRRAARAASTTRASAPRERGFLATLRPAFDERSRADEQASTSAAPPALLDELRRDELAGYQRLLEVLEQRAALLELLRAGSRLRAVRSCASAPSSSTRRCASVSLVGAPYGLHEPHARHRQPARTDADGLREGDPLRPRRRARSSRASSKSSTTTTERYPRPDGDESATTTRSSASRDGQRRRDQDGLPAARARAAPGRLRRSRRRGAVPRGRRGVRGALEARDARALRPLRPRGPPQRRLHAERLRLRQPLRSLLARSSATTSSAWRARRGARAAPTSWPRSRSSSRRPRTGVDARGPVPGRRHLRDAAAAAAPKPGTSPSTCPTCGGRGRLQHVSPHVFGEFVRTQTCPRVRRAGQVVETPVPGLRGHRPHGRGADARRARCRPGSTTASGSGSPARAMPASSAARAGDVYVLVHVRPDPRFVRDGNDIFSTVDLTMTRGRARDERSRSRRSTARSSSSSSRARSPARCASCAGRACRCSRASAAATIACS